MDHVKAQQPNNIPYWNVNIPVEQWTVDCPTYLQDLDEKDTEHLAIRDEDYHTMTWPEVRAVVADNRLELFKRKPSDLRRYRKYIAQIKRDYGSVMNLILNERVKWDDLTPKGAAFEDRNDLKILLNDWPYGIDPKIVHIVVWTKFNFDEDPATGELIPAASRQIDDFVDANFRSQQNPNNVVWFKNWAALKSVHAVEHFHVMLYDPDPNFVDAITGGDIPLSLRAAKGRANQVDRFDANK